MLEREFDAGRSPVVNRSASNSWTVTGGSPERNATSQASMPLPTERWVREIHSSLPEQQAIMRQSEAETQKGRVLMPKFELRMVGDLVLTKTTDASLLAIDFETGVIKWPLYFHNAPVQLTNLPYAAPVEVPHSPVNFRIECGGVRPLASSVAMSSDCTLVSEQTDQLLNSESMFQSNQRSRTIIFWKERA